MLPERRALRTPQPPTSATAAEPSPLATAAATVPTVAATTATIPAVPAATAAIQLFLQAYLWCVCATLELDHLFPRTALRVSTQPRSPKLPTINLMPVLSHLPNAAQSAIAPTTKIATTTQNRIAAASSTAGTTRDAARRRQPTKPSPRSRMSRTTSLAPRPCRSRL